MSSGVAATEHRRTGTIARVIDDNLNSWEDFAGEDINIPLAYQYVEGTGPGEHEQDHWSYRGQAAMCARTTDGAIVRVRIGDGSTSDRTVYRQIITDPTDPDNWAAWTQLYTGDHFAIAIQPDASAGAGYRIYHSKSDGLYVDNTKKITAGSIVKIKPIYGQPGALYYQFVYQDGDTNRYYRWYYTWDINAGSPTQQADCAEYRWYRHDMVTMRVIDSEGDYQYYRFRSMAHEGGARDIAASESLTVERVGPFTTSSPATTDYNVWQNVRFLKGPSGQAGFKSITNLYLTEFSSDQWPSAYYVFYNERHRDLDGNSLSNLKMPLFWSRSVGDPYYLSQPMPVGYSVWGFAGAVQWGDHVYIAGNDRVFRRSIQSDVIDISNYVLEGDQDIPRENGQGGGQLLCANPQNVLGTLLGMNEDTVAGLTDRRLLLALGYRGVNDSYMSWKRNNSWWVSRLIKNKTDDKQQLTVEFGDIWYRLSNPFRDIISIPGKFTWFDWSPTGTNQLYNYHNATDEFFRYNPAGVNEFTVPRLKCTAADPAVSITLYAGWRGENARIQAIVYTGTTGMIFRYVDENNYYKLAITTSGLQMQLVKDGTKTNLSTVQGGPIDLDGGTAITIDFRWSQINVSKSSVLVLQVPLSQPEMFSGFVGFSGSHEISNLSIVEFHYYENTATLLRFLFSYVDEHSIDILEPEASTAKQISIFWGPQSDLSSPEQAVRQLLAASKLETIWFEDGDLTINV